MKVIILGFLIFIFGVTFFVFMGYMGMKGTILLGSSTPFVDFIFSGFISIIFLVISINLARTACESLKKRKEKR